MLRRAIYLGAFVALNAHSLLTMPAWQPDTWNRVVAMMTRDFSAVELAAYAVFVLYGMWSLLLAALILIDGEGHRHITIFRECTRELYDARQGVTQRPLARQHVHHRLTPYGTVKEAGHVPQRVSRRAEVFERRSGEFPESRQLVELHAMFGHTLGDQV